MAGREPSRPSTTASWSSAGSLRPTEGSLPSREYVSMYASQRRWAAPTSGQNRQVSWSSSVRMTRLERGEFVGLERKFVGVALTPLNRRTCASGAHRRCAIELALVPIDANHLTPWADGIGQRAGELAEPAPDVEDALPRLGSDLAQRGLVEQVVQEREPSPLVVRGAVDVPIGPGHPIRLQMSGSPLSEEGLIAVAATVDTPPGADAGQCSVEPWSVVRSLVSDRPRHMNVVDLCGVSTHFTHRFGVATPKSSSATTRDPSSVR